MTLVLAQLQRQPQTGATIEAEREPVSPAMLDLAHLDARPTARRADGRSCFLDGSAARGNEPAVVASRSAAFLGGPR
jgi:hypothetical protein